MGPANDTGGLNYISCISVWIYKNIPQEIKHILRLCRLMEYPTREQDFN